MAHSPWRQLERPVTGNIHEYRIAKARPANTTAYAAGDVYFGDLFEFEEAATPGRSCYLLGGSIQTSKGDSVQVFRLHLYNAAPVAFADGAAFSGPRIAERDSYLGNISFAAMSKIGTSGEAYTQLSQAELPMSLSLPTGTLFAILEGTLSETPASGQTLVLRLMLDRN